ncbi:hypothetical protein AC579_7056 [Pseudocercospora musae]|uniref:Uncharacterized protein n=1 Tax=Pseudocercospora musae TaxID=113226 RepID=A0A139I1K0_9PEZI|nr:hypothetical protein AC579_7056 [Pseudocercospora musae]
MNSDVFFDRLQDVSEIRHRSAISQSGGSDFQPKRRHLEQWHQRLPFELQYAWPMSIAVWELHASYLSSHMILWVVARDRCQQKPDSKLDTPIQRDEVSRMAEESLYKGIHQSAQILSDFRSRYGLKITRPFLLVTASILVLDPKLTDSTLISSNHATEFEGSIRDSHTAFDEFFRCPLGTGMEVMIARGIARMVYHTALSQKNRV